jgi:hypothetical protein
MRVHTALLFGICLSTLGTARADGLLYRLPEDGTWARYSFNDPLGSLSDRGAAVQVGRHPDGGEAAGHVPKATTLRKGRGDGRPARPL